MTTEATPGALGSNDQLGLVPEREELRRTPRRLTMLTIAQLATAQMRG